MKLGKLTEVDIRELWKHEQYDFSEWLSKEDNIEMLSDEIGLTLTDVNKEVFVGSYRCDLVAKDETTGIKVIIENQLEATNHDHLGKIITYASGLDANVVIWIVKEAREEHRSAIEYATLAVLDAIHTADSVSGLCQAIRTVLGRFMTIFSFKIGRAHV